jgi:dihydrofolate reductase
MITLIAARENFGAIGKGGAIPWKLPEDLKLFQRETIGGAVIMGRKTWESLQSKPLCGRQNIVVTSCRDLASDLDAEFDVVNNISAAIATARLYGVTRIYGIGGQSIYEGMMHLADRILITEVDTEVDGADTFFPSIDNDLWEELMNRPLTPEGHRTPARLRELLRRRPA